MLSFLRFSLLVGMLGGVISATASRGTLSFVPAENDSRWLQQSSLDTDLWTSEIGVGAADTAAYYPLLEGRRVAVLANHTALVEGEHLVDRLHGRGFQITAIFSPEHGFRGTADAGEKVKSSVDERTGIPIRSLYDGRTLRPSDEAMASFDLLLVDMQDVGVRFYTYYISMLRMMDACAAFDKEVVVLDRPNPHGDEVDGPILEKRHFSGVGALPIPVLHGLTLGEIARMAVGEGWSKPCRLRVIPCRGYTHSTPYSLPTPPSPNLPTDRAVALYPSLCLFEGTTLSVGRGTDHPFECFGHPALRGAEGFDYAFTPRSMPGAKQPPHLGVCCHGVNLSEGEAPPHGLSLRWLVAAYRAMGQGEAFFNSFFEKLIGVDYVRQMILEGADAEQIEARWKQEVEQFRVLRRRYLLYAE